MMDYILLAGAALNFTGSIKMFMETCKPNLGGQILMNIFS